MNILNTTEFNGALKVYFGEHYDRIYYLKNIPLWCFIKILIKEYNKFYKECVYDTETIYSLSYLFVPSSLIDKYIEFLTNKITDELSIILLEKYIPSDKYKVLDIDVHNVFEKEYQYCIDITYEIVSADSIEIFNSVMIAIDRNFNNVFILLSENEIIEKIKWIEFKNNFKTINDIIKVYMRWSKWKQV